MNQQQSRKRKRIKLQCKLCRREFDDDFRLSHNSKYHADYIEKNKHVPYKADGAIRSPFAWVATKSKRDEKIVEVKNQHFILLYPM